MKDLHNYLLQNHYRVELIRDKAGLRNIKTRSAMSHTQSVKVLMEKFPEYNKEFLENFLTDHLVDTSTTVQEAMVLLPEVFYHDRQYYFKVSFRDNDPMWYGYGEIAFRRHIKKCILRDDPILIEGILNEIETSQVVSDICDSLAGYNEGVHPFQHGITLVKTSPKYITPEQGGFPMLDRLLTEMLGDEQKEYFYGWLKLAVENLQGGPGFFMRGHALFLVGEKKSCKTLLQSIITECLGGRQSSPSQYLMGQTTFNAEMFGSEHLCLGDESGKNWEERGQYSMKLKELIANTSFQRYEKGSTPKVYSPKWRITVSLNTDDESLKVIPILSSGLEDKISILKISKPHMEDVIAKDIMTNDKELIAFFTKELPALVYHLLNVHQIKESFYDSRFGLTAYKSKSIESLINANPAHEALFEALQTLLNESETFTGNCTELLMRFTEDKIPVERSFKSTFSLGRRLMEMSADENYKDHIVHHGGKHKREWKICVGKKVTVNIFKDEEINSFSSNIKKGIRV